MNGLELKENLLKYTDIDSCPERKPDNGDRLGKIVDFCRLIDREKFIGRRTYLTDGKRLENDAEHAWHLAVMALLLSEYAEGDIDLLKVVSIVLVHDLVEIYAGDTFAYDVEGNKDKELREEQAAKKLFSLLPEDQGRYIRSLWEEFDRMDTADSRFAASLDRLQPFMHNVLTNGYTWELGEVTREQVYKRMSPVKEGTPALWPWVETQIDKGVENGWIK